MNIRNILKKIIKNFPLFPIIRNMVGIKSLIFLNSSQYWNDRYKLNGNSGAGSYGRLAHFKAEIINNFIKNNDLNTVIEFGCGDGNQLALSSYRSYTGVDISEIAIKTCRIKFIEDQTKKFFLSSDLNLNFFSDLSLSLDVIYHLIEDDIFDSYMRLLFKSSRKFVIIYASNFIEVIRESPLHIKHRKFTDWVEKEVGTNWTLIEHIPNRFPLDRLDPNNTSFSEFYIFKMTNFSDQ